MEESALGEEPVRDGQRADEGRAVGAHAALPIVDDAGQSHVHGVCPFLRGAEGPLVVPATAPIDGQLCVAIAPPRAQSTSQQQLVCLRGAHADCPRYQRGALVAPARGAGSRPRVPRATLAALMILVLSAGISLGYVVQRGGLDMPAGSPSSTDDAVAGVVTPAPEVTEPVATEPPASEEASTGSPTAGASGEPAVSSGAPAASTGATPPTTGEATPPPTPAPTRKPAATPKPEATPKPDATPRSDRYKVLVKCPDRAGCWVYTVRSGDNLFSIAKYFGHSLKTIYAWNPQYPGTRLKAGAEIRMPPPTR